MKFGNNKDAAVYNYVDGCGFANDIVSSKRANITLSHVQKQRARAEEVLKHFAAAEAALKHFAAAEAALLKFNKRYDV